MWVAFFTLVRWLSKNTRDSKCGVVVCFSHCYCCCYRCCCCCRFWCCFCISMTIIELSMWLKGDENVTKASKVFYANGQNLKPSAFISQLCLTILFMQTRVELCVFVGVSFTTKSSFFALPDHAMLCTFPLVHKMRTHAHVNCVTKQNRTGIRMR